MKKTLLKSLFVVGIFLSGLLFTANTVNAAENDFSEEQYQVEKQKAMEAGYTEEQFKAVMDIPYMEAVDPVSSIQPRSASQQNAVVAKAKQQLGKPYVWGASGPNSFDCGGLVKYSYKQAVNMDLPMGTYNQEKYGWEVSVNSLQPSDLLFYGPRGNTTHVAIYIGNGQAIHAPQPGDVVKIYNVSSYKPAFARRLLSGTNTTNPKEYPCNTGQGANERYIFRLYNPNAGQHHFTQVTSEAINLINKGWKYEGVGFVAPSTGSPVYRLYNPNNGRHHYTPHGYEKDNLVKAGWKYEGIAWYSGGNVTVYRLYNPNAAPKADSHHYTPLVSERDSLVKAGWKNEGTAWKAVRSLY